MNIVWVSLIIFSLLYGIFTGRVEAMTNALVTIPKDSFYSASIIITSAIFWNGIMSLLLDAGVISKLTKLFKPILKKIMPTLEDEEALNYMSLNIVANIFGLGSAATPSGLKTMKRLHEIANLKEDPSNEMITFLVLNTAGVTLIPTTVITIRAQYGASNSCDFVLIAVVATFFSLFVGLLLDYLIRKMKIKKCKL